METLTNLELLVLINDNDAQKQSAFETLKERMTDADVANKTGFDRPNQPPPNP